MDPTASSISSPAVDGYAWAVTTDDGWVLLKAISCMKARTSWISSNQIRAAGHRVEDTPGKYEGEQCIHLKSQGTAVKLIYQNGVLMMRLKKPTVEEVKMYYAVSLTPANWDPYKENDVGWVAVKKEEGVDDAAEV